MKLHLKFKEEDKPDQMGLDHIIEFDKFKEFIDARLDILKDSFVSDNGTILHFTKEDGTEGIADLKEVKDSFEIEDIK
jgi:hypothetical protein